jgi:hypothetical protein
VKFLRIRCFDDEIAGWLRGVWWSLICEVDKSRVEQARRTDLGTGCRSGREAFYLESGEVGAQVIVAQVPPGLWSGG